ncbi:LysR substrate-binding domain-containing protein [Roseovarius aestuarii]|uniref:Glycine cleavage system transcriptional activator n=1 Tax=Roseovarius aestuarii TaxID=475083 RepID=A0A1X7BM85_9RHOB|nr:LysR substrate-binding domain-containing protein [Roseovarius aestuarii]SMC10731.1 Glycine cleavage system transcriptional activator [Roseovarius aestuarii]
MSRIPTTQALRALESFSRHGVVWKAAEELNLTRSAVSHQLRLLERDLGFTLFNRVGTGIELTSRGRAYANDVSAALSMISRSASRHAGGGLSGQLIVSCTPGFAANWLNTKVSRFRAICPEVSLRIVSPKALDDLSDPEADVFVAFGDPARHTGPVEVLREVAFTPLVSPVLLNRLGGLSAPGDVLRADLLHLSDRGDWTAWLRMADVAGREDMKGIIFADMTQVYSAAINAQGIAMGDEFICHDAMAAGHLVRPFDLAVNPAKSYYLWVPPTKQDIASVIAFRNWILAELPSPKAARA